VVAAALTNVRKAWPDGRAALDGLSLEVPEGRILVLLGRSGAGKTTALKAINRLVAPDSGQVVVLGREASDWDPVELRRRIGYVVQEGALLPHFDVLDNVAIVPRLLGWTPERRRARARDVLALVGLPPDRFATRAPRELSGGERQRVGVARALAAEPALLLMDEPFGALDPLTRLGLQGEFLEWQQRLHTSVVLVTHDVAEALRLADVIAILEAGRLLQAGTPEQVRQDPEPGIVRPLFTAAGLL
jgi:osmoprotectant transport system ATP-binding protein